MKDLRESEILELLKNHKRLSATLLQMKLKCTREFGEKILEKISKRKNVYCTYCNGILRSVSISHFTEIV